MWIYNTYGGFYNIFDTVYDDGIRMNSYIIIFDYPFYFSLASDLDNSSLYLHYSVLIGQSGQKKWFLLFDINME